MFLSAMTAIIGPALPVAPRVAPVDMTNFIPLVMELMCVGMYYDRLTTGPVVFFNISSFIQFPKHEKLKEERTGRRYW